ncbi:hypothetical protein O181_011417 [Austropuccinia psidii MF-1]|uniref:Uncharacterized protein n=1 Tax=Austropuccinia psidii MF-1 TaxID=1389203 RepID=A0A9Q3GM32_9BASI|nr:hypothetical protein [Austropuccinia psidii MF-1]
MEMYLQSKDLLDVCEEQLESGGTEPSANKWNKARYGAINIITRKIDETIFVGVMDQDPKKRINEQYKSPTIINCGRVWMEREALRYSGDVQQYISHFRELHQEISSVNIKIPSDILSYSILGKICKKTELFHSFNGFEMKNEEFKNPSDTLTSLQNYVHHLKSKTAASPQTSANNLSSLVTKTNDFP